MNSRKRLAIPVLALLVLAGLPLDADASTRNPLSFLKRAFESDSEVLEQQEESPAAEVEETPAEPVALDEASGEDEEPSFFDRFRSRSRDQETGEATGQDAPVEVAPRKEFQIRFSIFGRSEESEEAFDEPGDSIEFQREPEMRLGSDRVGAAISGMRGIAVRTTAYTHSESDHLEYGRKTASGSFLKETQNYNSAAADWSRYPLGTRFRIAGDPTVYVVDDYGSALVGTNTIDIYRNSRSKMNHWGVRNVEIVIIEPGCDHRSMAILEGRQGNGHCAQMYQALRASNNS